MKTNKQKCFECGYENNSNDYEGRSLLNVSVSKSSNILCSVCYYKLLKYQGIY